MIESVQTGRTTGEGDMIEPMAVTRGALAGWRRMPTRNGCILVMQVAPSSKAFGRKEFHRVEVALNDRQLRSLARDLTRAAADRGVELWSSRPWWKFWAGKADQQREAPRTRPRRGDREVL